MLFAAVRCDEIIDVALVSRRQTRLPGADSEDPVPIPKHVKVCIAPLWERNELQEEILQGSGFVNTASPRTSPKTTWCQKRTGRDTFGWRIKSVETYLVGSFTAGVLSKKNASIAMLPELTA